MCFIEEGSPAILRHQLCPGSIQCLPIGGTELGRYLLNRSRSGNRQHGLTLEIGEGGDVCFFCCTMVAAGPPGLPEKRRNLNYPARTCRAWAPVPPSNAFVSPCNPQTALDNALTPTFEQYKIVLVDLDLVSTFRPRDFLPGRLWLVTIA